MALITITDLEQNEELDHAAMSTVLGGRADDRLGPALGTQLLRPTSPADGLVPSVYDPTWRFDGNR